MTYGDFISRVGFVINEEEFWYYQEKHFKTLNDIGKQVITDDIIDFSGHSSQEEFDKFAFDKLENTYDTTEEWLQVGKAIDGIKDERFLERLHDYKMRNAERFI